MQCKRKPPGWPGIFISVLLLACCNTLVFADQTTPGSEIGFNERSSADYWRALNSGEAGYSATPGAESGVAINIYGQKWRQARNRILAPWGAWLMGGVLLSIVAFYAFQGPVKLPSGESDTLVARFTPYQRLVHWFTVILFLLLSLTGLILLYGRKLLEPLFGAEAFAAVASGAKEAHNLFGPIFLFALVLLIPLYIKDNLPARGDLKWLAAGGGLAGKHVSAGRFNCGEKIWFWLVCTLGLGLSLTGLVLDFASLGIERTAIELAHLIHVIAAFTLITVSFGHIYLGTVGIEGTLRGMLNGSVRRRWAEQHHDQWLQQIEAATDTGDNASEND